MLGLNEILPVLFQKVRKIAGHRFVSPPSGGSPGSRGEIFSHFICIKLFEISEFWCRAAAAAAVPCLLSVLFKVKKKGKREKEEQPLDVPTWAKKLCAAQNKSGRGY